jgi:hypothetical protein
VPWKVGEGKWQTWIGDGGLDEREGRREEGEKVCRKKTKRKKKKLPK